MVKFMRMKSSVWNISVQLQWQKLLSTLYINSKVPSLGTATDCS